MRYTQICYHFKKHGNEVSETSQRRVECLKVTICYIITLNGWNCFEATQLEIHFTKIMKKTKFY